MDAASPTDTLACRGDADASGEEGYYVATIEPPSAVFGSLYANFLGCDSHNLVINKTSRLEIYEIVSTGLLAKVQVRLNGRITAVRRMRPAVRARGSEVTAQEGHADLLFVCTEKEQYCLLKYDAASLSVVTVESGDLHDRACRPIEQGQLVALDPSRQLVALHTVQGLVKLIPITAQNQDIHLRVPVNRRIDELSVLDVQFLHAVHEPVLVLLHETVGGGRAMKTYRVSMRGRELEQGPWGFDDLEPDSHSLICVPSPKEGVLVVADESIFYYNHRSKAQCAIAVRPTRFTCHCRIDDNGYRYLFADAEGGLYVLILFGAGALVESLKLEYLGSTVIASTLTYLDNGFVYVGSHFGDSQVVSLSSTRLPDGGFLAVVEALPSLAPITDFIAVDLDNIGQSSLVACAGAFKEGSLRLIRTGSHFDVKCTVDTSLVVKDLFSLRSGPLSVLFASTISDTRIFKVTGDEDIEEVLQFDLVNGAAPSILIARVGVLLVQVLPSQIVFGALGTTPMLWSPPSQARIVSACACGARLAIVTSDHRIFFFTGETAILSLLSSLDLPAEPSALWLAHAAPPGAPQSPHRAAGEKEGFLAFLSLWHNFSTIVVDFEAGSVVELDLRVGCAVKSLVLFHFDCTPYLFAGLGDGAIVHCALQISRGGVAAGPAVRAALGRHPVQLCALSAGHSPILTARSERLFTLSCTRGRICYSMTNAKDVAAVCALEGTEVLVMARDSDLVFFNANASSQKLHHQTVRVGETVSRVVHMPDSRTFAALLCNNKPHASSLAEASAPSKVRLYDQDLLQDLDAYELPAGERAHSLTSVYLKALNHHVLVAGTAIVKGVGQEPESGRILTFAIESGRKLRLISQSTVPGCVYSIDSVEERLVAAINGMTSLYRWTRQEGDTFAWSHAHSHFGQILGVRLDCGHNLVAVGDLMKSVNLLQVSPAGDHLTEIARDYESNWMTEVRLLAEDTILGADNLGNLFILKKRRNQSFATEKWALEMKAAFHLGEMANRVIKGTLARQSEESSGVLLDPHLVATTCGSLYTIGRLAAEHYRVLKILESNLNLIVSPIGGLGHAQWRAIATERRRPKDVDTFIDGDLINRFMDLPPDLQDAVATGGRGCKSTKCTLPVVKALVGSLLASNQQ